MYTVYAQMTPKEAYDLLEALPPVDIKNSLMDMLFWQAKKGKVLVHIAWYLNCLKYGTKPRQPKRVHLQAAERIDEILLKRAK